MNDTHWFNANYEGQDNLPARRYMFIDGQIRALPEYSLYTWADGGLKSSSQDLARYLLAIAREGELNGSRILNKDTVATMLDTGFNEPTFEGQKVFWNNDGFMIGHNGSDPGAYSFISYDQYNRLGLVIMLNLSDDLEELEDIVSPHSDTGVRTLADDFSQALDTLNHLVYRRGLTLAKTSAVSASLANQKN